MGLLQALGLKPPKKKVGAAPSTTGPGPVPGAEGDAMMMAATDYAQALADAQKALAALGAPPLAKAKAAIEAKLVTPARAQAKAGHYAEATQQLGAVAAAVRAANDFLAARGEAEAARKKLQDNQYQLHVLGELRTAAQKIVDAQRCADGADWLGANAALVEARTACSDGEGFVRQYADTRLRRADVQVLLIAVKNSKLDFADWLQGELNQADALANTPARRYADAIAKCDAALSAYEQELTNKYVIPLKSFVTDKRALPGGAFVEPEFKRIEQLTLQIEAAITAHEWRKAVTSYNEADQVAFTVNRLSSRAAKFDEQRQKTVLAIEALKTKPALLPQVIALNKLLAKADALASRESMQIEDGIAALVDISTTCTQLDDVARAAADYQAERGKATQAIAALEKHPAADKIGKELAALRQQLAASGQLAGDAGSDDYAAALNQLRQLATDTAAATQVADSLTGVAAVEKAVAGKPDAKSAEAGLAALKNDLAAIRNAEHAELIEKDLKPVDDAVASVRKAIDAKQLKPATEQLVVAAQALAEARRKQVEATRNSALREALEQRMVALGKTAEGPKIAARIKAVTDLTKAAAESDGKGDFVQATLLLHQAETAAQAADEARKAREAHDTQAKAVAGQAKLPAYAAVKKDLEDALALAATAADGFDFAAAHKTLLAAQNKAKAKDIEAASGGASPNVATITARAKEMVADGAEKEVDALIARLPDNAKVEVLQALAEARFGIKFAEEAGGSDGKQQMAVKGMCSLLAKVPADVLNNPSLKQISRKGSRPFPFYQSGDNAIVMNSRPGESENPMFPKKPAGMSDEDWKKKEKERREKILPADVEPACQPANDKPEDYFDFNFLHEVAHAIDDAKQFMAAREKRAEFGGWISHGGDLDEIGKAVAKAKGFDKTPEQIAYVTALISNSKVDVPPRPAAGAAEYDAGKAAVDAWYAAATSDNVWEKQSLVSVLDIDGRIYHMAYSDSRTWVSYAKAARSRGITGYQFRAPGEWFSELYAAFKSGKLKKDHPSHTWLAELSI